VRDGEPTFPFPNDENWPDVLLLRLLLTKAPYRAKHGTTITAWSEFTEQVKQQKDDHGKFPLRLAKTESIQNRIKGYKKRPPMWEKIGSRRDDDDQSEDGVDYDIDQSEDQTIHGHKRISREIRDAVIELVEDFDKIADEENREKEQSLENKRKEKEELNAIAAASLGGQKIIVLPENCNTSTPKTKITKLNGSKPVTEITSCVTDSLEATTKTVESIKQKLVEQKQIRSANKHAERMQREK
jgi:hypothetical protein